MATRAARYALPFFGDDDGRLIGLPGASILIREAGTVGAASLWADRAKATSLANPLPTGVVRGAAGLDIDGNAVFYADPGDDVDGSTVYEAMVTVGNNTVGPVSIGTIPPDMADVASPVALAAVEADIATKADAAATAAALAAKQATIAAGTYAEYVALAGSPDLLIAGVITRDANDAATSAPVVWPNGQPGTYTATSVSTAFPGAVDAYTITYGSPATRTYTQPAVTRNANGAVTTRPAITVT